MRSSEGLEGERKGNEERGAKNGEVKSTFYKRLLGHSSENCSGAAVAEDKP